MFRYIKYINYLIRHKYYVMKECFKQGLYIQAITHDLSKFMPDEFIPYANYFYGSGNNIKKGRDSTGYYKPYETGDDDFDFAWLLHQKRNRHHWQWWTLPKDREGIKILEIDTIYIKEMICDWRGAGIAQNGKDTAIEWYIEHKDKMQLHPITRMKIEKLLGIHN